MGYNPRFKNCIQIKEERFLKLITKPINSI
jgi:hypothetical protein